MNLPATTLEQWAAFAAVVDEGSFAQAALALNRSQSSVSYNMARLQEALGVALLKTQGRRAVLTSDGKTLLIRARGLLKEAQGLEQLAKSLKRGWESELRITVDAAYPRSRLLDILGELKSRCPHTQIALAEAVLSGAEEAIQDASADLVVTSRVPSGSLGERLLEVEFIAAAHPEHPLFGLGRALSADDLTQHVQAVVRDSGSKQPRDEGWLGSAHRFTVSSMDASLALLLQGLAFAWLPDHVLAESLARGALRRLPLLAGGSRPVNLSLVLLHTPLGPAAEIARAAFKR
ncbi:MAG TPA: LysR family transcriptional regulator [Steroidobacteraceae bacterium]